MKIGQAPQLIDGKIQDFCRSFSYKFSRRGILEGMGGLKVPTTYTRDQA